MKRSHQYSLILIFLVISWLLGTILLYYDVIYDEKIVWLLWIWPMFLLISLGCYCLGRLGYDLLTFGDYPQEIFALEKVNYYIILDDCEYNSN